MPASNKRPEVVKARHALEMERLRALGWTQKQIAKELGIAQSTVSKQLTSIVKTLNNRAELEHRKLINRELAELNYVASEATDIWHVQKEQYVTIEEDDDGNMVITIKKDGREPNDNLLKRIMEASDRRAKLLGLVVERTDITSQGERVGLTADQLAAADKKAVKELGDFEARFAAGKDGYNG